MVESTNQEKDRLDSADAVESDTATMDQEAEERSTSSDSEDSSAAKDVSQPAHPASPAPAVPSGWKKHRLKVFIGILIGLLAVAATQARWYVNWQAQYAIEHRDYESAIWWLQVAKNYFPSDHWKTEFLLARMFRRQNNVEQMEAHLKNAYNLPGADVLAIDREQILAQAQNGQINKIGGDKLLQRLLINHRGDAAEIANAFVTGYLRNHDYHRAHTLLNNWIGGFGASDPDAFMLRAQMFKELQRWKDAEQDLRQVVSVRPKFYAAAWELGDVLRTRKQTEEALKYFQIAGSPDSPLRNEARVAEAHCLRLLGQTDQCRSILTDVLAAEPGRIDASMQLAMLEMDEDNFKAAVVLLEPLVKIAPRDARLRQNLGTALREVGRLDEAQKELAIVNQIRNGLTKARHLSEQMPGDPKLQVPFRYQIGMLHLQWGSEHEAVMWLKSALDLAPNHAPTVEALESLAKKAREKHEAARAGQEKKKASK